MSPMTHYLIFDIETRVDKDLVKEVYDPENGLTLEQTVEDGYFVVKSGGKPGWTHRWQGLDARR